MSICVQEINETDCSFEHMGVVDSKSLNTDVFPKTSHHPITLSRHEIVASRLWLLDITIQLLADFLAQNHHRTTYLTT